MAWANRVNTVSKQRVALFFCVRRILPALFFFGKVACGHSLFGRCLTITELMINEQIRDKEIRLIDENGEQLGIVSSREAQKARSGKDRTNSETPRMPHYGLR